MYEAIIRLKNAIFIQIFMLKGQRLSQLVNSGIKINSQFSRGKYEKRWCSCAFFTGQVEISLKTKAVYAAFQFFSEVRFSEPRHIHFYWKCQKLLLGTWTHQPPHSENNMAASRDLTKIKNPTTIFLHFLHSYQFYCPSLFVHYPHNNFGPLWFKLKHFVCDANVA